MTTFEAKCVLENVSTTARTCPVSDEFDFQTQDVKRNAAALERQANRVENSVQYQAWLQRQKTPDIIWIPSMPFVLRSWT
mmetsp:Transcript_37322/g.148908  ORF Transcript_37322/g.148908 Transcript_37322/m.148908 type:complete len:80 (+) Transcript_37322:569-808(+)